MKHRSCAFALILALLSVPFLNPGTARAADGPIHIRVLGRAPVLGRLDSAAQLRQKMHEHVGVFFQAARLIGLTPAQIDTLMRDIDENHLRYVTLPRHLERTTWASYGRAHVLYNAIIPSGTKGWEIDLRNGRTISQILIPAACGNLSIDPRRLPPPKPKPVPTPIPTPKPTPTQTPVPVPAPTLPPPPPHTQVVTQHRSAVPLILAGIALFFLGHTGSTTTTLIQNIPPTPPPCF